MATNRKQQDIDHMSVICTQPATPVSGDPVLWGDRPGVALVNEGSGGNLTGYTTVDFKGSYMLSVKGINGAGNSAVADGDAIYYTAGDTPPLSKKATGVRFGTAHGAVTSGATATIEVVVHR